MGSRRVSVALLHYFSYLTPVGPITIESDGEALTALAFGEVAGQGRREASGLTNEAANQLQEYLAGVRHEFDLPLQITGTPFQQAVYEALLRIPYGQTRSYGDIATAIGRPRAARAVGSANRHNPLPILVPCHRVIAHNGRLGGYAYGLEAKQFLLDLEHRHS